MREILRNLRWAARNLRKSSTYTLIAVVTLSLGIGATTAIYTVVQSLLLEPLPYPSADRLVLIQEKNPDAGLPRFSISPLNYRDYREMSDSFVEMAARSGINLALSGQEGPARRLAGHQVTSGYLRVLGVAPVLGRDFTPEDDRPGAAPVLILSDATWHSLGADPGLVGKDLRIEGVPTQVIGVLPPDVLGTTEALVPLRHDFEDSNRGSHWLIALGRLKDGVRVEEARAELETIAAQLAETYPDSNTGWSAIVDSLQARVVEGFETALWVLLAAVGLVLLIACANVANLTLARQATREREVALRASLGAGRRQLVHQMLTESILLALVAGSFGVLLAHAGTRWLVAMNADGLPRAQEIAVDSGVLVFAVAVSLISAMIFGLLPAVQASRPDLALTLKEGGRGQAGGRKGQRLRNALVLGEVALALVVLLGAGLLIRSLDELTSVDPGFDPDPVWLASFSLPESSYPEDPERQTFFRRLIEEASALPGVERAATVFPMPLSGSNWVNATYLEGEPIPPPNEERNVSIRFVSPGYFDTMGISLVAGRDLQPGDYGVETERVVVVNASAATSFWNGKSPVGKRISFGRPDQEDVEWNRVVGVVGDVHHSGLDSTVAPAIYRAVYQDTPGIAVVALRGSGKDPTALAQPLRDLVARLDPGLPLMREQTGQALVADSLSEPRFNSTLFGLFAALALVLSAIGVFGVVSYAVAQRQREMGVRLALGARGNEIVRLILGAGMRPVLLGITIGLLAALVGARLLESLVYGVSTNDPLTYAAVGVLLAAVAAMACLLPALRATRIDPMEVLRDE